VVNCELEARSAGCACLDAGCCRSFQGPADYLIEKHRDSSRNRKCCKTEPFLPDFYGEQLGTIQYSSCCF
jgi:hypothetical protein